MAKWNLYDGADVRPSVPNFIVVGLMAAVFIVLFKAVVRRFPVPGLNEVAETI